MTRDATAGDHVRSRGDIRANHLAHPPPPPLQELTAAYRDHKRLPLLQVEVVEVVDFPSAGGLPPSAVQGTPGGRYTNRGWQSWEYTNGANEHHHVGCQPFGVNDRENEPAYGHVGCQPSADGDVERDRWCCQKRRGR